MSDARPFRKELVFGGGGCTQLLYDTYLALTGTPLPDDKLARSSEPRGFMIGVGRTINYWVSIGEDISIGVEDWWEDNIADPDEFNYTISARTKELLDKTVAAMRAAAAARGMSHKS